MKHKSFKLQATSLLFALCTSNLGLAQWEPDVKITATPGSQTSDNNAWCIAAQDNKVFVVWRGALTFTDAILFKTSTDGGTTWNDEILLSEMYTYSTSPAIAVSGNHIHVAWSQSAETNNTEIFYNHSSDGGATWSGPVRITNHELSSQRVSIAASGNLVHMAWEDSRDYPPNGLGSEIYYKRSTDGGTTWSDDFRLTEVLEEKPSFPSIRAEGPFICLVFKKTPVSIGDEIYFMKSVDNGLTWTVPARLSSNPNEAGVCRYPTVGSSGENVYVFWSDDRDNGYYYEIYCSRSLDGGDTWGMETRLTFDDGDSYGPNVAVSGDAVHLTWNEDRDGNWEIYYKSSPDQGMNWSPDTRLTSEAADSWYPSIAVAAQTVNVVWCDKRTGDWNIYYKRDPSGNPVGVEEQGGMEAGGQGSVEVFPNPTRGKFQITSTKFQTNTKMQIQNYQIELVDLYGKPAMISPLHRMGEGPGVGAVTLEFDLTAYPAGIYFIRIKFGNEWIVRKIVKL